MKRLNVVVTLIVLLPVSAGAQQPAARQTDPTSHGGVILAGTPTVLIGGLPAARQSDLTTCPQVTPGPGGGTPHVGGPIMTGSATVLIGGLPAARAGDQNVESGGGGSATIIVGAPTVLIGG